MKRDFGHQSIDRVLMPITATLALLIVCVSSYFAFKAGTERDDLQKLARNQKDELALVTNIVKAFPECVSDSASLAEGCAKCSKLFEYHATELSNAVLDIQVNAVCLR